MKSTLRFHWNVLLIVSLLASAGAPGLRAQGTAFTYQGMLNSVGSPANGSFDLTFQLFNAVTNGGTVGPVLTNSATAVSNGLFTVTLDFGPGIFTGTNYWVEISARTNGNGAFTTLIPRLPITPTPYAIAATTATTATTATALSGTVANGSLSGTYTNAVTLNSAGNSFTGNGAGISNVNAATVGGVGATNLWLLNGNAGTTPGPQFLGTTDSNALELHVAGLRALRLEPATNGMPNVIGGSISNAVAAGVFAATVGGGDHNTIQSNAQYAAIPGGVSNVVAGNYGLAAGQQAQALHPGAFVWADSSNAPFASTTNDQFLIRAAGGVGINTNNPNGAALYVNGAVVAASFSGAGTGLTVPASNVLGSISVAQLPGAALTNNESSVALNGAFTGNGTGLTNVNAATVGGVSATNLWLLNGNAGATPGPQFVGTTDTNALELRVNGSRAFRLEPTTNGPPNVIGGSGSNSVAAGDFGATIAGGDQNTIQVSSAYSTIGGGASNMIQTNGYQSVIAGGYQNMIETNANNATISGGNVNIIQTNANNSTIAGGGNNTIQIDAISATVSGGSLNTVQSNSSYSVIAGGFNNTIQTNTAYAAIGGGNFNSIQTGSFYSAIGGGLLNQIQANATNSTIGGGTLNSIQINATNSTIGGGVVNTIQGNSAFSTIGGGTLNSIQSNALYSAIGGGLNNVVQPGATNSTIGGGKMNLIRSNALYATIPGGSLNLAAGNYSFAAGQLAQALHQGAFVWADSQSTNFASTNNDSFNVRAQGGVVFTDGNSNSVSWSPGAGSWAFASDRNLKDRFAPVNETSILEKVARLPLAEWSYKGHEQRHIGAMAQDFHALFPLNDSDRVLNDVDLHGVELAAIKGLNRKIEEQARELKTKDAEIQALEERLQRLENRMSQPANQ